jgi:CBS domain-containing protein
MSTDKALRDNKIGALSLPKPLCVTPGTSLREALAMVRRAGVGALVVVEGGKVVGLLTERDVLMKVVARGVDYGRQVKEFMTADPHTLTRDRPVTEAVALLNREHYRHLPIVDEKGAPVAMLRMLDIIQYFAEAFPEEVLNLPPRPHQAMETPEGA